MSIETIERLSNAIPNVVHVERPYLENALKIKKLQIAKGPIDKEVSDATSKVTMWETELHQLNSWSLQWFFAKLTVKKRENIIMRSACTLQAEIDRAAKCLEKANKVLTEVEQKAAEEDEQIRSVETMNEKYYVDYRALEKYREDLGILLDDALKGNTYATVDMMKRTLDDCIERCRQNEDKMKRLEKVKDLIRTADLSLMEGIIELRSSTLTEKMMGEGKVYFPQVAFDSLKQAREECPELPGFPSPQEYVNEADNTGAYYSPMQKYLWDVRKKLAELIVWCDQQILVSLDIDTELQIEVGLKTDEYNLERCRVYKELL
ncbi:hypothetical protein BDF20DRAFT_838086 [Mycotypha africana]|uniref:uncharacterized protein n=1 Tax=Mycotypha africana TaxID=64632 RepID=UPI0023012A94|nr:uncharacterized protein BDF20DRAFT_838086 [Mycotypha africana]KAI8971798.1 hypothetical protein BDF20DRAFT_838086 [Mycotypha africana]